MEITALAVSMFETNCFLVVDERTREGAVIDPGDEADRIIAEIDRLAFTPKMILLTHGHGDHIGAAGDIKNQYRIPLWAGIGADATVQSSNMYFESMFGIPITCPAPDRLLADGESVVVGSVTFTVIATPGHSPGGVCYLCGNTLFCGDTLFSNSIGRTDLPGGNHRQLIESITRKLLALPDDTICYPGHGPVTTIGHERRYNPFLAGNHFDS